jgi:hypothetical protein
VPFIPVLTIVLARFGFSTSAMNEEEDPPRSSVASTGHLHDGHIGPGRGLKSERVSKDAGPA